MKIIKLSGIFKFFLLLSLFDKNYSGSNKNIIDQKIPFYKRMPTAIKGSIGGITFITFAIGSHYCIKTPYVNKLISNNRWAMKKNSQYLIPAVTAVIPTACVLYLLKKPKDPLLLGTNNKIKENRSIIEITQIENDKIKEKEKEVIINHPNVLSEKDLFLQKIKQYASDSIRRERIKKTNIQFLSEDGFLNNDYLNNDYIVNLFINIINEFNQNNLDNSKDIGKVKSFFQKYNYIQLKKKLSVLIQEKSKIQEIPKKKGQYKNYKKDKRDTQKEVKGYLKDAFTIIIREYTDSNSY